MQEGGLMSKLIATFCIKKYLCYCRGIKACCRLRRKGDSNPRYGYPYDSLANCWFQPLTHLSVLD